MTAAVPDESGQLSVRAYTVSQNTHSHQFHQVVVPLNGSMKISMADQHFEVGVGQCIVIPADTVHGYSAAEPSGFLVADMQMLPQNAAALNEAIVSISDSLLSFCSFARQQLEKSINGEIEILIFSLFWRLLDQENFAVAIDKRIQPVITLISQNLKDPQSIEQIAALTHLSVSQFQTVFHKSLGCSFTDYLTNQRMEQARALLVNSDMPIGIIANEVGYHDASAFSRRFRQHFGQSPSDFKR